MVIKKFGGTSVKGSERIKNLIEIISGSDEKMLIVVSAIGGVTNLLVSICDNLHHHDKIFANNDLKQISKIHSDIIKELDLGNQGTEFLNREIQKIKNIIDSISQEIQLSPNQKDSIISTGEILSSKLIHLAIEKSGRKIVLIEARDVLKTDNNFTDAEVDMWATQKQFEKIIKPIFDDNNIAIMGGFIASNNDGKTTTIGRGGSDYTASIAANMLDAERLEIWTDVDGIMTVDPKFNPNAKKVLHLSYDEAAELAYFGARVLHPKTIGPAIKKMIPVKVKNSFYPKQKGTLIADFENHPKVLKALSYWEDITVINIKSNRMLGAYGFLSKVFEIFNNYETPVDLIATSEVSLSLTIDNIRNLTHIIQELEKFSSVSVTFNHAIISAIGDGIKQTAGIAARFFGVLKDININMVSIGASEVNLSVVLKEGDLEHALNTLHKEFFEPDLDPNLFESN